MAEFGIREVEVYVVPGDTFLFAVTTDFLWQEGTFLDYIDAETDITTRYRVQDVIVIVREKAAGPPIPGAPSDPLRHPVRYKVEVVVV